MGLVLLVVTLAVTVILISFVYVWILRELFRQKKKKTAYTLILLPVLAAGGLYGTVYWFLVYHTNPSNIELQVTQQGNRLLVDYNWNARIERYSLKEDVIVISTRSGVQLHAVEGLHPSPAYGPVDTVSQEIEQVRQKNPNTLPDMIPHHFTVPEPQQGRLVVESEQPLNPADYQVQFVHGLAEPMDPFYYWVHTWNAQQPDPQGVFR